MRWRTAMRAALAGLALTPAACGSTAPDRPGVEETLLLDSRPSGVHAGIYLAVDRGFDEAEGVELTIERPRRPVRALELLQSGRADFAILDIHDLGLARQRGADVVGVMAVVQRPVAAVPGAPGTRRPAYPGLLLAVTRTKLEDRRNEVRATIRALQRGYGEALTDPESAVQAVIGSEEGLDPTSLAKQFDAVAPVLRAGVPAYGLLEAGRLRQWARWAERSGILDEPPDVARAFDTTLVGPSSRD